MPSLVRVLPGIVAWHCERLGSQVALVQALQSRKGFAQSLGRRCTWQVGTPVVTSGLDLDIHEGVESYQGIGRCTPFPEFGACWLLKAVTTAISWCNQWVNLAAVEVPCYVPISGLDSLRRLISDESESSPYSLGALVRPSPANISIIIGSLTT